MSISTTIALQKRKEKEGGGMLGVFESLISKDLLEKKNEQKQLNKAADLVKEMPFVTLPFKEKGFFGPKENTNPPNFIHVFQPNIWGQDLAFHEGKLEYMTIGTSEERGFATARVKLENKSVRERLRNRGKTEEDFLDSMIAAALIESAYYSRIGGDLMDANTAHKIDIAIMKRAIRNNYLFGKITKSIGIDIKDEKSILEASKELDLTEYLQEISITDPYFNRRKNQVKTFNEINSTKGFNWEDQSKGKMNNSFIEGFVQKLLTKKKVNSGLIKEVTEALKN